MVSRQILTDIQKSFTAIKKTEFPNKPSHCTLRALPHYYSKTRLYIPDTKKSDFRNYEYIDLGLQTVV